MSDFNKINNNLTHSEEQEVELDLLRTKLLKSMTDKYGQILSVNDDFVEISGYQKEELIDKPHNLVRHHDMPKAIFKMMWEDLKYKRVAHIIVKNKNKSGAFFWTALEIKANFEENKLISYSGQQSAVNPETILKKVIPLYQKLLLVEQENGIEESEAYLENYLDEQNKFLMDLMDDWVFVESEDKSNSIEIN